MPDSDTYRRKERMVRKIETVMAIIGTIANDGGEDNVGKTGRGKEGRRGTSNRLVCCCLLLLFVLFLDTEANHRTMPRSIAAVLITTFNGGGERGMPRETDKEEGRKGRVCGHSRDTRRDFCFG